MAESIYEREQKIPVYKKTDVLVVGGGPAGLGAAVSAARNGAKVILMERYGYLGGMATGGSVLLLDSMCDGKGNIVVKGLVEEVIARLRDYDGIIEPPQDVLGSTKPEDILKWSKWGATGDERKMVRYSPVLDPEMMKCVANDMTLEAGVDLLLHAWFSKPYIIDGAIRGAIFESKSGRQAVLAKIVIDCTGDGDVFYTAGESYVTGNLPLGLVFRVGNVDVKKSGDYLSGLDRARKVAEDVKAIKGVNGGFSSFGALPYGSYIHSSIGNVVWFNTTMKGDATDIADLARVEVEIRRSMIRTMNYLKQHVPGFENAVVIETAPQVGVRGTRMLDGEYTITGKELREGTSYEDTVVVAQPPYRNFHVNDRLKEIPYRCFVPKKTNGLLVAGRCLSADLGAASMLRLIPIVMLMGQACGTAAAMAAETGIEVRDVNVSRLQGSLRSQNVWLPTEK
ncbi:MAG: FAD-dependent oxidoreductase [Christensenellales bacterium]